MKRIFINNLDREFNLDVCKVNKSVVGTIPKKSIERISRTLGDIDTIDVKIDKYVYDSYMNKVINPLWIVTRDERLICLNDREYFVVKVDDFQSSDDVKSIKAYSLEYKLSKIDIVVEDIAFCLTESDVENDVYSLGEYLYEETGWKLGHVDDSVRYDISEDETKTEKLRLFPSVNKRWYDFLMNDVCESFNCIVTFDTYNKLVNLYDINTVGENIQLYLSHDNYVKSLGRVTSSEDICTRLYVVGSEEMDIIDATVSGYPYLEDYSYFIDNGEMSDLLISHINKYNEMLEIRNVIWRDLVKRKLETSETMKRKKDELYAIYEEIRAKKSIKEVYASKGDSVNEAIIAAEITILIDKQTILEVEIKRLEEDVINLDSSIVEINILCKRETATDENGQIIFTTETLDELKEFIYHDTYTNDSFLDVNDLIVASRRELDMKSNPTVDYTIDVKNFMDRIIDNEFRVHFKGDLGLGDIIILYDEDLDEEVFLYLTEYSQMPNEEDGLDLTISNKKFKNKNVRVIADKIKEGSLAMRMFSRKAYLFNQHKYKRINLDKNQIGGNI
ncbi:MAG: phage tail protein [Sarcina sp.]